MENLTQALLKELLHYSPETGLFTWKVDRGNGIAAGAVAGYTNPQGYKIIRVNGKNYRTHRLAILYVTGEFPSSGLEVDHLNHVRDDNRLTNLRLVMHKENTKNQSIRCDNTTGQTGVDWQVQGKIWRARIKVEGEEVYLGCFKFKEDAIAARKAAEIEYGYHENHGQPKTN